MLTFYLCFGMVAGCYFLSYCIYLHCDADEALTREEFHKRKCKADWIAALGIFMLITPVIIAILLFFI